MKQVFIFQLSAIISYKLCKNNSISLYALHDNEKLCKITKYKTKVIPQQTDLVE